MAEKSQGRSAEVAREKRTKEATQPAGSAGGRALICLWEGKSVFSGAGRPNRLPSDELWMFHQACVFFVWEGLVFVVFVWG